MGNIFWFIPIANEKDYNLISIGYLIQEKLPDYDFYVHGEQLSITNEIGIVAEFWFSICVLLQEDENDLVLKIFDSSKEYLTSSYQYDRENRKLNNSVNRFIHKHFKSYWLDEGIHPEFIEPDYKFKSKSN